MHTDKHGWKTSDLFVFIRVHLRLITFLAIPLYAATPQATVHELVELVRAGLRRGQSDGAIAKQLRNLKPAERIDLRVIEELESEGAGEKSMAELSLLREIARDLQPPPGPLPFANPPEPSPEERDRVLSLARSYALDYSKSLPDFICMQRVRRSDNARGRWQLRDTLDIKLTFFDQKEDYRLLSINGRAALRSYRDVGGATSQGEFGSLLRMIFDPQFRTAFQWDHWTALRKRPTHVFSFHTAVRVYRMEFQRGAGSRMGVSVGQRGYVYVDRETNNVIRIIAEADGIPLQFPVRSSSTLLDYEFTKVGAREFLLPLRAEIRMDSGDLLTRNEVEFRSYQKFSSEATITFDPK